MIGPEKYPVKPGSGLDSDVVGNVFRHVTKESGAVLVGGDGTGSPSFGQYRFVNNTFLFEAGATTTAVKPDNDLDSVSMYNNVFYNKDPGNAAVTVLKDDGKFHNMIRLVGSNNSIDPDSQVLEVSPRAAEHCYSADEWQFSQPARDCKSWVRE